MLNSFIRFYAPALFAILPWSQPALADDALWNTLRSGGNVILVRHATTDPGVGDPTGFKLSECPTQRNLNESGRAESRRLGHAFSTRNIPITAIKTSRWCRCIETAKLAFGRAEPWPALDNTFDTPERRTTQLREVREALARPPANGNLVLVTHGINIAALTGVDVAQGEIVIVRAGTKKDFQVIGRMTPAN